jgi:hypothetical protein
MRNDLGRRFNFEENKVSFSKAATPLMDDLFNFDKVSFNRADEGKENISDNKIT